MKYFGTDGIRRDAQYFMEGKFLERFASAVLAAYGVNRIAIARDSRISGLAIEERLTAAFRSYGADVELLGIAPTPELVYYVCERERLIGVMITASHNPPNYNGLKLLSCMGNKSDSAIEGLIEYYIDKNYLAPKCDIIGSVNNIDGRSDYIKRLDIRLTDCDLGGLRILLDCGFGAASNIAKEIFSKYNAKCDSVCDMHQGELINLNCGAMYADKLDDSDYDLSFSFDGDADRVICKRNGVILDGDSMIYLLALGSGARSVAVTTMSNGGLIAALTNKGIKVIVTGVGDKFIQQAVAEDKSDMGAEQSGHIILSKYFCTGDGILAAIIFASEIAKNESYVDFDKFPQRLINFVGNKEELSLIDFSQYYDEVEYEGGRLIIRPSGTESMLRVLVEMPNGEHLDDFCGRITEYINKSRNLQ